MTDKDIRIEKTNRENWNYDYLVKEACKDSGLQCEFVCKAYGYRVARITDENGNLACCYDTDDFLGFVRGYKFAKGMLK